MKRRAQRVNSPVVFCGNGNHVCVRKNVAREIRDAARASAVAGHVMWR